MPMSFGSYPGRVAMELTFVGRPDLGLDPARNAGDLGGASEIGRVDACSPGGDRLGDAGQLGCPACHEQDLGGSRQMGMRDRMSGDFRRSVSTRFWVLVAACQGLYCGASRASCQE